MAQNEMKAKPALPERVRSMEGLGVCERKNGMYSTSYKRERRITAGNLGEENRSDFSAVVCKLTVLLPCLLVGQFASATDEPPVLLNGGSMINEGFSQEDGNLRPIGVHFVVSRGCLNSCESSCKRSTEFCSCDTLCVSAVHVKKKGSAKDCGKECGDDWGVWWHWMLAGLLPMLMFLVDALVKRDETPNV